MEPPGRGHIVRWLTAGLLFMGVNTALLYALVHELGMTVAVSTVLSAEVCTLTRFILNEYWVFGTPKLSWKRLWQFHVANGGAFVVWWIATNMLTREGLNYLLASILAVGPSTRVSFASNFFWIWRKKHPHKAT
jgi:putative flippase GtrA